MSLYNIPDGRIRYDATSKNLFIDYATTSVQVEKFDKNLSEAQVRAINDPDEDTFYLTSDSKIIMYYRNSMWNTISTTGASTQIQSDWNQVDATRKDFINNRPEVDQTYIPTSLNAQSGVAVSVAIEDFITADNYATRRTGGTVIIGDNLDIDENGILSATGFVKQVTELPTPSEELNHQVYQYLGAETEDYKYGHFYSCNINAWVEVDVNTLPIASSTILGGIKIGDNLYIDNDGVVSAGTAISEKSSNIITSENDGIYAEAIQEIIPGYKNSKAKNSDTPNLYISSDAGNIIEAKSDHSIYAKIPNASDSTLGGIKVGENLSIETDGTLNAVDTIYTLPAATTSTLGGIKVGDNLTVETDGTLNAIDTTDYDELSNKPSINGTELSDNKTLDQLDIQKILQFNAMPAPTAGWVGKIIQYTGTSTEDYLKGQFYECIVDSDAETDYTENITQGSTKSFTNKSGEAYTIAVTNNCRDVSNRFINVSINGSTVAELEYASGTVNIPVNYKDNVVISAQASAHGTIVFVGARNKWIMASTIPAATTEVLGGVKVGENLSVEADGTLSMPLSEKSGNIIKDEADGLYVKAIEKIVPGPKIIENIETDLDIFSLVSEAKMLYSAGDGYIAPYIRTTTDHGETYIYSDERPFSCGCVRTPEKIDLTDVASIKIKTGLRQSMNWGSADLHMSLLEEIPSGNQYTADYDVILKQGASGSVEYTMDVSEVTGSYYIVIGEAIANFEIRYLKTITPTLTGNANLFISEDAGNILEIKNTDELYATAIQEIIPGYMDNLDINLATLVPQAKYRSDGGGTLATPSVVDNHDGSININGLNDKQGLVRTPNAIDLTKYTSLHFKGSASGSSQLSWSSVAITIYDDIASDHFTPIQNNYALSSQLTSFDITVDVSGIIGSHYISVTISFVNSVNVEKILLVGAEDTVNLILSSDSNSILAVEQDNVLSAKLPIASVSTLGGIKVGENLSIDEDGTLNASSGTIDYEDLTNKPSINSVELSGNKSLTDLSIQKEIPTYTLAEYEAIKDTIPVGTIFNISDDPVVLSAGAGSSEPYIDVYSTEETLTNKVWLDGSPIYRKVFTGLNLNKYKAWTLISNISVPNITRIINFAMYREYQNFFDVANGWIRCNINNGDIYYYALELLDPGANILVLEYTKMNSTVVPLVPTMTSNTTPSGVCSSISDYSTARQPWKAFMPSGEATDSWLPSDGTANNGTAFISYAFANPITVHLDSARLLSYGDNGTTYHIRIQALVNDQWINVSELITLTGNASVKTYNIDLDSTERTISAMRMLFVYESGDEAYIYKSGRGTYTSILQFYGTLVN